VILVDQGASLRFVSLNVDCRTVTAYINAISTRVSTADPAPKLAHRRCRSPRKASSSPTWGIDCRRVPCGIPSSSFLEETRLRFLQACSNALSMQLILP
jgi:hypothetical protein